MNDKSGDKRTYHIAVTFETKFEHETSVEPPSPSASICAALGIVERLFLTDYGREAVLEMSCRTSPAGALGEGRAKTFLRQYVIDTNISSLALCTAYFDETDRHPLGWTRFTSREDLIRDYVLYCTYYNPMELP